MRILKRFKRFSHDSQTCRSRACSSLFAALTYSLSLSNFAFVLPAGAGVTASEVVQEIRIQGNERVEDSAIISYLELRPGSPFNGEDIDASLANLFATGFFTDVKLLRSGSTLIVRVVEKSETTAGLNAAGAKEKQDSAFTPRVETNVRLGSDRSTAMLEAWMPIAQRTDSVLYADLRLMSDDVENREGNIGLGYRTIPSDLNAVLGSHVWLDRRVSTRGSTFHQIAAGVEVFREDFDFRANVYQPIYKTYRYLTPNAGQANPYLLNSGIFYDAAGVLLEQPLRGADFEVGVPVTGPLLSDADSVRLYGGGYVFGGGRTDTIYGKRLRLAANITPDVEIGARIQHDNAQGSQGFLEATFRFPVGSKPSYRANNLRARLADSPERDIDIVTGATVTDTGHAKPVLSTFTGEEQRVFHVDNSSAPGGSGTLESPFNTLATADAAANLAGDVIYVHRGDGTSTGMNQGVTLNQEGQWLMGTGSAFIFDSTQFQTPGATFSTGTVIAPAGLAPVISNVQVSGHGVSITAGATGVAGVTVQGAQGNGINAFADVGQTFESITVRDVTASSNASMGVFVTADGAGAVISNITVTNVTANSNGFAGVYVNPANGGHINTAVLDDITTQTTGSYGLVLDASGAGAVLSSVTATNVLSTGNTYGVYVDGFGGGQVGSVTLDHITVQNNSQDGIQFRTFSNAEITAATATNVTASGNLSGITVNANGTNSVIGTLTLDQITSTNNTSHGIALFANGVSSTITSATLTNVTATGNVSNGLYVNATGSNSLSALIQDVTATGNTSNGVFVDDDTTGTFVADLGGGTRGSTGGNRIFANTATDLRVDLDGLQLKAEDNWWGDIAGLQPGRVTLDAGSTVDAVPFLVANPGP